MAEQRYSAEDFERVLAWLEDGTGIQTDRRRVLAAALIRAANLEREGLIETALEKSTMAGFPSGIAGAIRRAVRGEA